MKFVHVLWVLSEGGTKGVEIAAIVGVPVRTVQRLVKEFRENGTYKSKTCSKKYGKKLSDRDVRGIKRVLQANRRITLSDITNMCPTKVCRNTIRKALHDSGIQSRIAVKKPFLTPRHMSQRLAFAQKYCRWSAEEWEQVIWTDESTFEVGKNSRQIHVWRTVNERFASSCIVPTFKSGRTSLMIWGAFSGGRSQNLFLCLKIGALQRILLKWFTIRSCFILWKKYHKDYSWKMVHLSIEANYVNNGGKHTV